VDENNLKVSCPLFTSDNYIKAFIVKQSQWLAKQEKKRQTRLENSYLYQDQDYIYIFGEKKKFTYIQAKAKLIINEEEVILSYPKKEERMKYFYRKIIPLLAEKVELYLPKYLSFLKENNYLAIPEIKYSYMKSRWGVCYGKRNLIRLNSALIHYPPQCLDQVLAHECVHFLVFNHSKQFYYYLSYLQPNYKEIKKLLH